MKLNALNSVEIKAIEFPERISVPNWANKDNLADRIFGAFCRINPELPCMENKKFIKNVFTCIKSAGGKDFISGNDDLVTFVKTNKEIAEWRSWYEAEKIAKAAFRKTHKDEIKKENDERKALYGTALVNGVEEPLQSWIVEPEGIFFGRGDSPINGFWKVETVPEDVVLNTNSKNLPEIIINKKAEKKSDWNVDWNPNAHFAATYNLKIGIPGTNGRLKTIKSTKYKMIAFGANSSIKKEGQSKKYAAASELASVSEKLSKVVYEKCLKGNCTAIALYILMNKGIRIGYAEATENGTKGLLSLEFGKDVKENEKGLKFDFYGKDSVRDTTTLEIEDPKIKQAIVATWKRLGKLQTTREEIKAFVSKVDAEVGKVFTPKLIRTMVAAETMTKALNTVAEKYKLTKDSPEALKKLAFDEANMEVAKKLNHQRGVNKVAEKKREEANKQKELALKEREKKAKELKEKRLAKIATLKEKGNSSDKIKKLREQIKKSDERILQNKRNLKFKEENGNITAATSKSAYIDPTICKAFCDKYDLPLEKIYSKSQLKQFNQFFEE